MSLSLPYRGRDVACASAKLVSNQLESCRALNSDAMMVWVAKSREESALEMKVPMRRTHTMWPTEAGRVGFGVSGFEATASSSTRGPLLRSRLDSEVETSSLDASLEDRLKLLSEQGALPGGGRRGVPSVLAMLSRSREKA